MSKKKSDITLKISAVVIALILWFFVMDIENPEGKWEYRGIEVIYNNVEALEKNGLVIMNPKEFTIAVEVGGKTSDRIDFSEKEHLKAEVDLSGYSEGKRKVPINVTIGQSKLSVIGWEPREILFDFEKIINIDKSVTIRTEGELASGYVLGDISTRYQSISLRGPRSWVNEVSEIIADINITDRKEDINVTVPIKLIDDEGNIVLNVESKPSIIDVSIPVYRTTTVPIEIVTVGELPENYEIGDMELKPSSITLKGKDSIVNLKSIQTKPIDINYFMENEDIVIELDLPRDVSLLDPDEKITVSLKIEEAFTKTFEYNLEEVEVRNLDPSLIVDFQDVSDGEEIFNKVEITLKGNQETIENLSKEDIEVYMDLSLLRVGEHDIYLGFDIPSEVTVNEVIPQPIKVNLIVNDFID